MNNSSVPSTRFILAPSMHCGHISGSGNNNNFDDDDDGDDDAIVVDDDDDDDDDVIGDNMTV